MLSSVVLLCCCEILFLVSGIVLLLNWALWVGGFLAFGYGLIVGIVSCGGLLLCCGGCLGYYLLR